MRTTYKEYGCTASITDKQDGTARLMKSRRKTPAFRHGDISRVLS